MKVFAVLGDQRVAHSLSPRMHNAVLSTHGVEGSYVAFKVEPADLGKAVEGLKALNVAGVNVTVPHKEAVVPFLDGLSEEAKSLGAVNTLVPMHGAFWGDNTDVGGFSDALAKADFMAQGKKAMILGAGGAARAVALALLRQGAKVTVAGRSLDRAKRLTRELGGSAALLADGLNQAVDMDLLVNATSVSSPTEAPELAKQVAAMGDLRRLSLIVDINYGRTNNFWQDLAEKNQAGFRDGLFMLAAQACRSFSLWTGLKPSTEEFFAALRDQV